MEALLLGLGDLLLEEEALPDRIDGRPCVLRKLGVSWSQIVGAMAPTLGVPSTVSDLRRLEQKLTKRSSRAWLNRHAPGRLVQRRVVEERFFRDVRDGDKK